MLDAIDEVPPDRILGTEPDALAEYYESEYWVDVPVLDIDATNVDQADQKIDVSRDQRRTITDRSRPFYIDGTRVTFHVPYRGDKALFDMRPSTWSMNPPRALVQTGEIVIRYDTTDHQSTDLRRAFDRVIGEIQQHLERQRSDVDGWNAGLRSVASSSSFAKSSM